MFILITGPSADRPERGSRIEPNPNPSRERNGSGHGSFVSSGFDAFAGTIECVESSNCFNNHLTEFARRVIERINNNNEILPGVRNFITTLVSNRAFCVGTIGALFGPQVVERLNELNITCANDKEAQQREMLMALIAIDDPVQMIRALNNIKGELLPQLQSLASGMLDQARDFAKWLAEKRAKQGDPGVALALYAAEQSGGGQETGFIQAFLNTALSYNPSAVLNNAISTAEEVARKKRHEQNINAEIKQLEQVVDNTDPHSTEIIGNRARLTDLKNTLATG